MIEIESQPDRGEPGSDPELAVEDWRAAYDPRVDDGRLPGWSVLMNSPTGSGNPDVSVGWLPATAQMELKLAIGRLLWEDAQHVQHLYEKLDVSDRAAAVAKALREGVLH